MDSSNARKHMAFCLDCYAYHRKAKTRGKHIKRSVLCPKKSKNNLRQTFANSIWESAR